MTYRVSVGLLFILNIVLAASLVARLMEPGSRAAALTYTDQSELAATGTYTGASTAPQQVGVKPGEHLTNPEAVSQSSAPLVQARTTEAPRTAFEHMYSENPQDFAANLRAISCPEATVRDIIVAEVSRKYRKQEENLRPTPADHVPMGWSSATSEARLLQRRVQAAALARQKAVEVEQALGYSVPIGLPLYAMTATDRRLELQWEQYPEPERILLNKAQEEYWNKARTLQERTSGFWQSDDYSELKRARTEWQQRIQHILEKQ